MQRKTMLKCSLLLFPMTAALLVGFSKSVETHAADIPTIDDECDTLGEKTSDYYNLAVQATDVGFGLDSRFLSKYAATAAPTASTMWSDYGFLQYAIAGQNYLNVICDEGANQGAPLVWANTAQVLLTAVSTVEKASTNWTRRAYTYVIPATTDWIRIIPVAHDDGAGNANWSQQITEVKISYLASIDDGCDVLGEKTSDYYNLAVQATDVGFGLDSRFLSKYAATAAPTADTMWSDYGFLQYAVNGQNLLTVVADEGADQGAPLVYANTVKAILAVNNKTEQTSTNWTRRTYVYIIPATTDWIRIIPIAHDDGAGNANWSQQITEVKIELVGQLPASDTKPTPETVTKIDDSCDATTGNTLLTDFYHVDAKKVDEDGRYTAWTGATAEPTASTWWAEQYGYVQYTATQQNLLTVNCFIADAAYGYLPPLFVYAGTNNKLSKVAVNNTIAGVSANGFTNVTYQFILSGQTQIRLIIPSYTAPDGKFSFDAFQISNVKMEYSDSLPAADPISTAMDAKKAEIDTFLGTLAAADYSQANWTLIEYYVTIAKYDIAKAADAAGADAVIAAAKTKIQAVKTLAVEKKEAKDAEVKRLTDFVATLKETDYTAENWAKIQKFVSDATAEIEPLDDLAQVKQIIDDTISDIQAVPVMETPTSSTPVSSTPTSSTPETSTPSSSSTAKTQGCGGCSGDVTTGVGVAFSALLLAGILFLRRKKVN